MPATNTPTALAKHIRTIDADDESVTIEIRHTDSRKSKYRVPREAFLKMARVWADAYTEGEA